MSDNKREYSLRGRKNDPRRDQEPMRVDHNMDWQSSTSNNKPKRPRLDRPNGVLITSSMPPSRYPVTRQPVSSTTTFLPPVDSQVTKSISSTVTRRRNSQSKNEHHRSINAPLATPEDISIDNSTQDLVKQSSRNPIRRTPRVGNSDRLSKNDQYSSHKNIQIEDTSTKKSRSLSTLQSHRSTDRKTQDEEMKASIRIVPRISDKQTKTVDISSRDDGTHMTRKKRSLAESVPECLDLTVTSTHSSKDMPQSSKSSSQEKSFKKTDTRGQCGLRNIGNTCFMNSALQCLSNVPDLTKYILENDVTDMLNTTNDLGTHGKLAVAYVKLIREMWSGEQTVAEGSVVKRYVSELSPRFAGYSQQDSHEFLNVLLDALHEDLKQDAEDIENETSLISEIFHGQIRSTVTCDCGEPLITYDSISFLALPIPDLPPVRSRQKHFGKSLKRTVTLTDCFNELFKVERLSENGQWYCNACNCLMDADKQLDLWAPPQVLILQLKRFTYDLSNNVKIQTLVEFPFDSPLELRPFITDPDYKKNTLYDLVAISSHTGSLAGGHYTAYAKNFRTKKWLHFNDEIVREADEKALHSPNVYILVYRRQEINL